MNAADPTLFFTSSLTATALCLYNVSIAGLAGSPWDSDIYRYYIFQYKINNIYLYNIFITLFIYLLFCIK